MLVCGNYIMGAGRGRKGGIEESLIFGAQVKNTYFFGMNCSIMSNVSTQYMNAKVGMKGKMGRHIDII